MSKTELAPAPKRRSYPKALKAQIVAKFTDHLPLYRQEGILARAGLQLRALDAGRVGRRVRASRSPKRCTGG